MPGQRYLRQTEGRGGQALTISTRSVLTLQADQEPLEAAYCYLLGWMAVTTAWGALPSRRPNAVTAHPRLFFPALRAAAVCTARYDKGKNALRPFNKAVGMSDTD